MSDPVIICPKCKATIKLNESLAGPLLEATKEEYETRMRQAEQKHAHDLAKAKTEAEAGAIQAAKDRVADELKAKDTELADANQRLYDSNKKLADAQRAQADFLKKQRELEDQKRELDLTVERRVSEGVQAARTAAKTEAEEMTRLKMAEKDHMLESLQQQIDLLKKKAEQGSQQLQGEVQELAIEDSLKAKFPQDDIEPVAKGVHGGDILQTVYAANGQAVGKILWESKRTKTWSQSWLPKLRDDQRDAKADVAILVTETLPKGSEEFSVDWIDGVWVVSFKTFMAMAAAMHLHLVELATARKANEGQETKMGMVYEYLTGPRFKQRVQAIVEAFTVMKDDLDKERKAITKQWTKREEQIERVMQGTVGMYGDLQGIAGKSLGEVEGLSLKQLEA